jgi:voltage-gated potassium channel Kch
MGYRVAELLNSMGEPVSVVAMTGRPQWMRTLESLGVLLVEGDARLTHLLTAAGVQKARSVVVAVDKDTVAVEIAAAVREVNPEVPLVIRATDRMWADFFERGVTNCRSLCVAQISAVSIAAAAMHEEVLFTEHFHEHAFTLYRVSGEAHQGRTVAQAQEQFGLRIYTINGDIPSQDQTIRAEDTLISSEAVEEEVAERKPLRAAKMRVWLEALRVVSPLEVLRLITDIWRNAATPIRATFVTLSLLVLITSLVYYLRNANQEYVDALFYAVAVAAGVTEDPMATTRTMWKLFDILVIVSGAGLATILFTMTADYILSMRMLEFGSRVYAKRRNHVIIAGLGKVGHRVAEILLAHGELVVGIEMRPDAPYLIGLRRSMPVLLGDAADPDVLRRANVRSARAIVAATDNDASNIRIALTAEKLKPQLESVIRVFDVSLAKTLDRTYGIHSAVSPADTSAPTFAMVALCKYARLGFAAGNHFFGVYEVRTSEADTFTGKTPLELAGERKFVILSSRDGRSFRPPAASVRVEAGQTVIFSAEWSTVCELPGFAA